MKLFLGTSIALCATAMIVTGALQPAVAADQAAIVKAPAAAVVCTNLNWSHGWLSQGGWGGWGYIDGLTVDGWPDNCSEAVGVGPYAYAPREAARAKPKR